MNLYRTCKINDFAVIDGKLVVVPHEFVGNRDSAIPTGTWSFWLGEKKRFTWQSEILVESRFPPEKEGDFKISGKVAGKEYVTSSPVEVAKIWILAGDREEEFISILTNRVFEPDGTPSDLPYAAFTGCFDNYEDFYWFSKDDIKKYGIIECPNFHLIPKLV